MESRNGLLLAAAVGVGTVVAGMSMMAMSRCEASGAGKAGKAANEAELEAKVGRLSLELKQLQQRHSADLEKAAANRQTERNGRIAAEKQLRAKWQLTQRENGHNMMEIGHVQGCFMDKRGTPRQPILCPDTRAAIVFNKTHVQDEALTKLENFSHCWVIFVFHENTNLKQTQGKVHVPAKVAPPRLGGEKVGLFATRTPHRPNPIGLSVCRIETVVIKSNADNILGFKPPYVLCSGVDLINGTPILDIKPYIPYDCVPSCELRVPTWVQPTTLLKVTFALVAAEGLQTALSARNNSKPQGKGRKVKSVFLYGPNEADKVKNALQQVLAQEIRSLHQQKQQKQKQQPSYSMRFDGLDVSFRTDALATPPTITVTAVVIAKPPQQQQQ